MEHSCAEHGCPEFVKILHYKIAREYFRQTPIAGDTKEGCENVAISNFNSVFHQAINASEFAQKHEMEIMIRRAQRNELGKMFRTVVLGKPDWWTDRVK